jgi:phage major head subunit gpT-like protein
LIVNSANLRTLGIAFKATFQGALKASASTYPSVATLIPATTKEQEYGWLGSLPRIREWIGDRQINSLKTYGYKIAEKKWEGTLQVDKDDIETDNIGIYTPKLQVLGEAAGSSYDELVWPLLNDGFTSLCYDGQYFFDTDHPVLDKAGNPQSVANTDGGAGTPWFLIATDLAIKPIILQKRKDFTFVAQDQPNDEGVFYQNMLTYGVDARHNAGYGLWQGAWGSKQTLDADHYTTALAALQAMKTDYERPLNFKNFVLVVPPSLRSAGAAIVNVPGLAGGANNNTNYQTAKLQVEPWLA